MRHSTTLGPGCSPHAARCCGPACCMLLRSRMLHAAVVPHAARCCGPACCALMWSRMLRAGAYGTARSSSIARREAMRHRRLEQQCAPTRANPPLPCWPAARTPGCLASHAARMSSLCKQAWHHCDSTYARLPRSAVARSRSVQPEAAWGSDRTGPPPSALPLRHWLAMPEGWQRAELPGFSRL